MVTVNMGDKFGRWTVIDNGIVGENRHMQYLCRCSCNKATERRVDVHRLLNGTSTSCGCYASEKTSERRRTHGDSSTRLYKVWLSMKARCNNPNNDSYNRYGGNGITVCEEWNNDFLSFKDWAYKNGFDNNLKGVDCSIDRKDNKKGYSPDNCRWITNTEQCNNRSTNIVIEYNGESKTATEWARTFGLKNHTVIKRYKQGRPLDEVFAKNLKDIVLEYDNEKHTLTEWSKIRGIKKTTLWSRYDKGLPIDDIMYQGKLTERKNIEKRSA